MGGIYTAIERHISVVNKEEYLMISRIPGSHNLYQTSYTGYNTALAAKIDALTLCVTKTASLYMLNFVLSVFGLSKRMTYFVKSSQDGHPED